MASAFWVNDQGYFVMATPDDVMTPPAGAVEKVLIVPSDCRQRWNGASWDPLPPPTADEQFDSILPPGSAFRALFVAALSEIRGVPDQATEAWLKTKLP